MIVKLKTCFALRRRFYRHWNKICVDIRSRGWTLLATFMSDSRREHDIYFEGTWEQLTCKQVLHTEHKTNMLLRHVYLFITSALGWMHAMQALAGLMLPAVASGALYRSATLYHPRRHAILHIKRLKKTTKQRREFENKPPYFDFSPLRMRMLQLLCLAASITSLGSFVPFVLMVSRQ